MWTPARIATLSGGFIAGADLDFAAGRYALNSPYRASPADIAGWSFSRTGAGTAETSSGAVLSFATGVPRIVPGRGMLVEGARTNLLLNSATLSTQSVTVTAAAHTLSFRGTGTVTLSGASTAGPLVGTGAGNTVSLTFTPSAGTLTLSVTGTVTNAQLEAGAFPSSYIPTTGSAATRGADFVRILGLSALLNEASPYTIVVEAEWPASLQANAQFLEGISASGEIAGASIGINGAGTRPRLTHRSGANRADLNPGIAVDQIPGQVTRMALNSLGRGCANAGPIASSVATPTQANWGPGDLGIGLRWNFGGGLGWINSYIRRIRILPYAAPDAELQTLTL